VTVIIVRLMAKPMLRINLEFLVSLFSINWRKKLAYLVLYDSMIVGKHTLCLS
jgi:hypothetical protein